METKNNSNLIWIIVALIIGIIVGYFMGQSNMSVSEQGAVSIKSGVVEKSTVLPQAVNCEFDQVWNGRECRAQAFSKMYLEKTTDTSREQKGSKITTPYSFDDFSPVKGDASTRIVEGENDFRNAFQHGSKVFTLWTNYSDIWSLNVCAISTSECPGYGQTVTFTLVGGGSGGQDGEEADSDPSGLSSPGSGGVGGSTGGAARFNFLIPTDGLLTSFSGKIGLPGFHSDYGSFPNAGTGSNVQALYNGNFYTLAVARGASFVAVTSGPSDYVSLGGGANVGVTGSLTLIPPPILNNSISNALYSDLPGGAGMLPLVYSTFPSFGGICNGGTGGSGSAGWMNMFGAGGAGGHGGYNNSFPSCMAHGQNYNLTDGVNGLPGVVMVSW